MPQKRSFYEAEAEKRGFRAVDSVGKGLSLLVAADISSKSSKLDNAARMGIKVIPVEEFMQLPLAGEDNADYANDDADLPLFADGSKTEAEAEKKEIPADTPELPFF
jgi:hypothetical protein